MLWLLLAAGCGGEEALPEATPEAPLIPPTATVRYTQEDLAADPSAVTISGQLVCDRGAGPWKVRLWSLGLTDSDRAPDALPTGDILTELTIAGPGPFTILSARSARLLMVAMSDDRPPVTAWGDPHGRYTEAVQDLASVVLDCSITPTPAPDGSRMATLGEVVLPEPEAVAEGADPQMDRLIAIPAAPKVDVFSRAPSDFGGPETVDRIEARYRNRLTEDELQLHMLMLYQLADDPKASDDYVNGVVSSRSSSSSGKSNGPQVIQ